jgi:GT2 family glycosyltransferase
MSRMTAAERDRSPLISVVIASVNGLPHIANCLTALLRQEGDIDHEIIIVDRCGERTGAAIRERFARPELHWIEGEPRASIPRLRAIGMARARGETLAILEDHCSVAPNWLQVIARARSEGHRVVGGAIANGAVDRVRDWAAFFCEYSAFMPPVPRGAVAALPGNNCAYERRLLDSLEQELYQEVWEYFLHARLRERGALFWSEPELVVSHDKRFDIGYFLAQRYHYSRSFVTMRFRGWPRWKRLAYGCALPGLPPLLLARMARSIYEKKRHHKEFLRALPLTLLYLVAGAVGEAVGALVGAGRSLEKVE